MEWVDARDEAVWFVSVCRRYFLKVGFFLELEVSDLVAQSDEFWAIRVEGDDMDDVSCAVCLLS